MTGNDDAALTSPPEVHGFMAYPTGRLRRFMFKAPLYLWRLGLGPIIGRRFVVLTATGRKSGLPRHTMLEYSVVNGKKYLASGWGARAQWYKNILADPHVTIQTAGDGVESAVVRRVDDDAELTAFFTYLRRSPVWEIYLEAWGIQPNLEDFIAKKDHLYVLRLDPTDAPTPPPLEADLKWVWLVVLGALIVRLARRLVGRSGR